MILSIFLAKLLGIYFLIIAAMWLFHKKEFEGNIKAMGASQALIAFSGVVSLVVGLAIVIAHPTWELDWTSLITLIGYIAILQGFLRIAFTKHVQNTFIKIIPYGHWLAGLLLIVGGYLTYHGFLGY